MENNISEFLTEEHKELIKKGITKVIRKMDFDNIVREFIEKEFEYASESCNVAHLIDDMITKIIRQHLIKSGLLKEKG